ncbi:DUF3281 family protein [Francisella tularensis subsp. novicida]|uniref:DUF3281 family protein n=1 Tax=Francisella tularensis TaxID=263 RepID=UPI0008FD9279|nr:DUF3281 family protein [Francisella tularensis]APC95293.1 hypothetical protein KX02_1233 [Francisella tularensis subsp. novicida]MBK2346845.1 DUF3281 family protein [Francisella tularensis subsp. novicida]
MTAKKKLLIGTAILSSAAILGSCGKSETATQLRIVDQCNTANDLCKFELTNAVVSRYTNLLGKTIERVESQTPLQDIQGTITWNPPAGATLATNTDVVTQLGSGCQNDSCTANANPTAFNLQVGSNSISVSGTITVNGKTVDLASTVPPVTVDTIQVADSHVFQSGTLPAGLSIGDLVTNLNINARDAHGTFSEQNGTLKITCETGYEWIDDQDPPFGSFTTASTSRSVAMSSWLRETNSWINGAQPNFSLTQNGVSNTVSYTWIAGCWQK